MSFVSVEIQTNEEAIREEGLAKLKELLELAGVVGWVANEADLAVIELSTVASMVPAVAEIASVVPPAVFRKYGTELVKTPYNEGAAATATVKFTLLEEGGKFAAHTIEAGVQLVIGEKAFYVQGNTSVAEGESTKNVVLVASERGSEFNGLTGAVELVDAITWVKEVAIIGETSGGVNQESDEEYENRLAAALKLQAPRPITAANFAEMALDVPSSVVPTGVVVGRATAIDGYNPATTEAEGKVTTSSTTMTEVTSFAGITPKTEIEGTGIHKGTTVVSINTGAKTLVMSSAATESPAKKAYKFIGSFENERTVTVFVTNREGRSLTAEAMADLEAWLREFREINFVVNVREPRYNEIRVTAEVHVLPRYAAASVVANVKTAIESFLSPATFGNPSAQETGSTSWLNIVQGYSLVRYNTIVGLIEAVPGVQYVPAGGFGLAIALGEPPETKVFDLPLQGAAPLTETKAANITVTAV